LTSAECRVQAEQKLAQAERDDRNRKRLITAAEAWLFLANRLRRVERVAEAQGRPKRARRFGIEKCRFPLSTRETTRRNFLRIID